ncbi:MAG: hypothetical protein Q4F97_00210 [Bacteroidales bacterium]|nr:hypothetical protein [Bacteroidales bacterium]
MGYKYFFVVFVVCAALSSKESLGQTILKQEQDVKSGITYNVSIDNDKLILDFRFSGPLRMMQMAQSGFNVYFNEKGKKKKNVFLKIPGTMPPNHRNIDFKNGLNDNQAQNKADLKPTGLGENDFFVMEMNENGSKKTLQRDSIGAINQYPSNIPQINRAFWVENDQELTLDVNNNDVVERIIFEKGDKLNRCLIELPLSRIIPDRRMKIKNLMIGLFSEKDKFEDPIKGKMNANQKMSLENMDNHGGAGRMQGPPPGGGQGGPGMNGGGMGAPGIGRGMGGQNSSINSSNNIKLWIKCKYPQSLIMK